MWGNVCDSGNPGGYIKEKLREKGANDAQLASKTVKMMEQIATEDSEFLQKEAFQRIDSIARTFEKAQAISNEITQRIRSAEESLKKSVDEADRLREAVFERESSNVRQLYVDFESKIAHLKSELQFGTITNSELSDAVNAYKRVLESTKEVFGDNCTENVIIAATQAGSYIGWRGIMGPKELSEPEKRKKPL